ncbi:myotubularin-related protein 12 isoform X2 [Microcaecilia unicolor]|uniref:Myotubularin-related protein 12 n=1 Tax=Microcaecilia unicolor TaxID=1415580 RepID=A0A6P7X8Q0_9AMPH|nr:myotubularin-related protein 12 isoform X2 [Microcaecilia unicolor]
MLGLGAAGGAKPAKPSFVSYLAPEEIQIKEKEPNIHLLPGELVLCEASMVLKCMQDEGSLRGVYGRLVCTNFKISFLCDESATDDNEFDFKNKIIGENDITLHCVDQIYGVYDEKRKCLLTGQVKKYPEKIIILCKDFRVFHFCLRYTKEEEVKRIVSGIIHHTQSPILHKRLFLFSYAASAPHYIAIGIKKQAVMFDTLEDWRLELDRTKGNIKYKVVSSNASYGLCEKLPPYFVVPVSLMEEDISEFQGKGIPIWCWSCHNGSALLKMAALPKEQDESMLQRHKTFSERIDKTVHRPPYELSRTEELANSLPSLPEIQMAYGRFKQLFWMENRADFWDSDVKWFSLLENSNWLEIIRQCLTKAIEVAEYLETESTNVILKESASDLCCVIAGLVQMMMDPYYRTKLGFQSLVQKEWVMGGHAFLDRCNHLRQTDKEEAPVFLLFLDCVWQLVQQYPVAFQFTETYLTVLSDSLYLPIFSTFFFNSPCHKDIQYMCGDNTDKQSPPLSFHSVWDWSVQFDAKVQALLKNPLYVEKSKQDKTIRRTMRSKHQRQLSLPLTQAKASPKKGFFRDEPGPFIKNFLSKRISKLMSSSDEVPNSCREFYDSWHCKPVDFHGLLLPHVEGPLIQIWAQRCLRWIPDAQILGGGLVAMVSRVMETIEEVESLRRKLEEKQATSSSITKETEVMAMLRKSARFSSLYPFALLSRISVKPVIPTSTWRGLEEEDDLVKRDDEFIDLGNI